MSADAGGVRLWRNGDSAVFIRGDAETARVCRPQAEAYVAWPAAQAAAMEAVVGLARIVRAEVFTSAGHRITQNERDSLRALGVAVDAYLSTLPRAHGGEGGGA